MLYREEEESDDIISVTGLKDLSSELISECIMGQIKDPHTTSVNFLESFNEQFEAFKAEEHFDDDEVKEAEGNAMDFYKQVLDMIDDKLGLDIDYDILALDCTGWKNLCDGIYSFFIVNYEKNLTKYFLKLILEFSTPILNDISNMKRQKDVTSTSLKKKMDDKSAAALISNVNFAIGAVVGIETDANQFMSYFDVEKFDVTIVNYALDGGIITGDFVERFIEPAKNLQSDVYEALQSNIRAKIFKKYIKK